MIYCKEIPLHSTVFGWLKERTHYAEAIKDIKSPLANGELLQIPLPMAPDYLRAGVQSAIKKHGLHGFVSSDYTETDPAYANMSLTWNPRSPTPQHQSTLGSPHLTRAEHFYGSPELMARLPQVRDSYYDSYGFCTPTQAMREDLGRLHSRLKRTMVRSRISVVRAGRVEPTRFGFGWHRDEEVFQNLRLNIPVVTAPEHRLQIMRDNRFPEPENADCNDYFLDIGSIYSLDTNIPHRPCTNAVSRIDRAHIIIGISPWFDYFEQEDAWAPNEFFGKKHPLQMLLDGDVL